jgi:Tetratricopeptide repeat
LKRIAHIVLLLLIQIPLTGQPLTVQKGTVLLQNSSKTPLIGVTIHAKGAPIQTSDSKGRFSLSFRELQEGYLLTFLKIEKPGYEIVNNVELESAVISSNRPLKIIMCKKGQIQIAKAKYYEIISSDIIKKYEKEISKLNHRKISDSILLFKITDSLTRDMHAKLLRVEETAEELARFNMDDATESTKKALRELQRGNVELALKQLSKSGLLSSYIKSSKKITIYQYENEAEKKALILQAELLFLSGETDSAKKIFDTIISIETNDYHTLFKYVNYLKSYYDLTTPETLLQKFLKTSTSDIGTARANEEMADIFRIRGQIDSSRLYYTKSVETSSLLYKINQQKYFYDYAVIRNNYGIFLNNIKNPDSAILYLRSSLYAITDSMYKTRTDVLELEANVFGNLSHSFKMLAHQNYKYVDSSILFSKKALNAFIVLTPKFKYYELKEAQTMNLLGTIYQEFGQPENALDQYYRALQIYKSYTQHNWTLFSPNIAMVYDNIGNAMKFTPKWRAAMNYYDSSIALRLEYEEKYPFVHWPGLSQALNNRGNLYLALDSFYKAESDLLFSLELRILMATVYPGLYTEKYTESLHNIGVLYCSRLSETLKRKSHGYFNTSISIRKNLTSLNPAIYASHLISSSIAYADCVNDRNKEISIFKDLYETIKSANPKIYTNSPHFYLNATSFLLKALDSAYKQFQTLELLDLAIHYCKDALIQIQMYPQITEYNDALLFVEAMKKYFEDLKKKHK